MQHNSKRSICLPVIIVILLTAPLFSFSQSGEYEQGIRAKALSYFNSGDIQQGKKLYSELIDKISKPGNEQTEADYWHELALLIPSRDTTGITRMYCFERMLSLYKRTGNEVKEIKVLQDIADTHLLHGKFDLAEAELLNVLQRYKAINYPTLRWTYNLLAVTNSHKGDYTKGIFYGLKAIESMEAEHEYRDAPNFYSHLGHMYRELGQPVKSVEWYWKLFKNRSFTVEDNMYIFRDAGLLTRQLIKLKKDNEALTFILDIKAKNKPSNVYAEASMLASLAYCYYSMDKDRQAEKYYIELTKLTSRLHKNNEITTEVNYELGQYFLDKQQYEKAATYFQNALNASEGINTLSITKDIYMMLYKSDSAMGNYLSAIQHLLKHKMLNDSIFNETKSRQIEELQVQYETAKKEKNIEFLNNQNQLQSIRVEQANKTKNITLAGALLLLIIIGLLFNRYLIKQRSNRKFEIQQQELDRKNAFLETLNEDQNKLLKEKEWLIKEVHHRVKNNLQIIMSLLDSQSVYIHDNAALTAINDSQRRVHAISLIHQSLYQSENTSSIDMPQFVDELISYLKDSFGTSNRILFEQDIKPLKLDVAKAIPLGLFINESIVNAIKYAFPGDRTGSVHVSLKDDGSDYLLLNICDNGIGLPPQVEVTEHDSLGFSLMQGLAKQLKGRLTIESNHGVKILVRFAALNNFQETFV